ncbi:MAG TPA: DUF2012 domain-containing protein [Vicinamibacterales bacterium]
MVEVRRIVPVAVVVACALLGACSESNTTAPTPVATAPTPTPTPTPSGPTFTISGTLFETAPRATQRVPEAEVQLSGGVATGSISDGTFTIPNVAAGTYTLSVAKAGYETKTMPVTVSGANVSGIQMNLMPVFRFVDREFSRELKPGDPSCQGTTRPCHTYPIASHHGGDVRAFLAWNSDTADFDFEFWCGNGLVESRGIKGGDHDEILPRINAGQTCEVHVLHSGAAMPYTLYLTHPY